MPDLLPSPTLPAQMAVTIQGACQALAPDDAIERRARAGRPDPKDAPELLRRRVAVVRAAVRVAETIDASMAAKGQDGKPGANAGHLAPARAWLAKPSEAVDAEGVMRHAVEVGLASEHQQPVPVIRAETGNGAKKAAWSVLKALTADTPGASASYLLDGAMALARALETAAQRPSGELHAYVAGLVGGQ